MQVDIEKFENKLRTAEASLGIKAGHGVPIVYERGEDALSKFLTALILGGILLSLFSRGKGFKAPSIADALVRLNFESLIRDQCFENKLKKEPSSKHSLKLSK